MTTGANPSNVSACKCLKANLWVYLVLLHVSVFKMFNKPLSLATLCDSDVKRAGKQYTPGRLNHMMKVPVCD